MFYEETTNNQAFNNFSSDFRANKCFCATDSLMAGNISCDTTYFSNKSKIFWQFNCDDVWLTFENKNGRKLRIDDIPVELSGYTYRLGYHLIKEYNNSLLFRNGCSASGPCSYTLIDKTSGNKIEEFDQLICIDTDIQQENDHSYNFDFIVYLSDKNIVVDDVESRKKIQVPFKDKLTAGIPEQQFDK